MSLILDKGNKDSNENYSVYIPLGSSYKHSFHQINGVFFRKWSDSILNQQRYISQTNRQQRSSSRTVNLCYQLVQNKSKSIYCYKSERATRKIVLEPFCFNSSPHSTRVLFFFLGRETKIQFRGENVYKNSNEKLAKEEIKPIQGQAKIYSTLNLARK